MIRATAIVQVMGRPKEHAETVIKQVAEKVKESFTVDNLEIMDVEPIEGSENIYSGLFEVDLQLKDHEQLFGFIQEFNPQSIEVSDPDEFEMSLSDYNALVTTVASTVQQYDQLIKEKIGENVSLQKQMDRAIRNLVTLSIAIKPKQAKTIQRETGLNAEVLKAYLARLIKDDVIERDGDLFRIKDKSAPAQDTA